MRFLFPPHTHLYFFQVYICGTGNNSVTLGQITLMSVEVTVAHALSKIAFFTLEVGFIFLTV